MDTLRVLAVVFCAISIIAAGSVVRDVFGARYHRRKVGPILVLVGWMSLADVLWAARFLINDLRRIGSGPLCTLSGVIGQGMGAVLVSTNFVIGVDVLLSERFPFSHSSARCLPRYLAWVAFVAISTAAWVAAVGCYGPSPDGTCWIEVSSPDPRCEVAFNAMNYITLVYVAFCTLVLLFFAVNLHRPRWCFGARRAATTTGAGRRALVNRMAVFTGTFLATWVPFQIFFLGPQLGVGATANGVLQKYTLLTTSLTGLFNWLV